MNRRVPDRPRISDILLRASANREFCSRLLADPDESLSDIELPAADRAILAGLRADTLAEYARQLKAKLLADRDSDGG